MNENISTYCTIGQHRLFVDTRIQSVWQRNVYLVLEDEEARHDPVYRLIFSRQVRSDEPLEDHLEILMGLESEGLSYLDGLWAMKAVGVFLGDGRPSNLVKAA